MPTSGGCMANRYQSRIEILQGTLDLLILQTLQWGPQHGYGISQAIRLKSGELFDVETGSLYPALHRLERSGWISSDWKTSENKQRVKQYRLLASGQTLRFLASLMACFCSRCLIPHPIASRKCLCVSCRRTRRAATCARPIFSIGAGRTTRLKRFRPTPTAYTTLPASAHRSRHVE